MSRFSKGPCLFQGGVNLFLNRSKKGGGGGEVGFSPGQLKGHSFMFTQLSCLKEIS